MLSITPQDLGDDSDFDPDRNIQFTEQVDEAVKQQIVLYPNITPEQMGMSEEVSIRIDEVVSRNHVDQATNQLSAGNFANNSRAAMGWDLPDPYRIASRFTNEDYLNGQWINPEEMIELADRWCVPVLFYRLNANHWILALKAPELDSQGKWRVLTYDPMKGSEIYTDLPLGFKIPTLRSPTREQNIYEFSDYGFYCNQRAHSQLLTETYNFSIAGDDAIASNTEVRDAKQTKVQISDAVNCGLYCLFAAAIREGMKKSPANSSFRERGRAQLQHDSHLYVRLREEVLGNE
jgi:hypothetical protein